MKTITILVAVVLGCSATAMTASTGFADGHCGDEPETHYLKIRVAGNKPVEVIGRGEQNMDDVTVCPGDKIEWKLQGQARRFYLDIDTPLEFGGKHNSSSGKIEITVDDDTENQTIKYLIGLEDGEEWDPRIIVDD